ncbi:DUF7024 domain-containing protein [Pseudomonas viridiflava]|uniref:DUF7024 domain-containing protein n=1 Tax=Pseudomonas viridiflava TaxID=33069 RepID=A0A3M5PFF3_PSEVI|nr:hypothetical protein [Pseudomonas viridiflava]RMT83254.1 hypothetical protein ALP40_00136 [Pseudomonas viridiflava]
MNIAKSEALLEKIPVSFVLFAAFIFYMVNSIVAGSPIFASDEYVYFISGKNVDQLSMLYGLDPALQRLSNLIFFHEVKLLAQLFGDQFVPLFRIFHGVEYVLAGGMLYASVKELMPKPHALMGLMVFLALPSHLYIYAVMPEVELIFLSAMVVFTLVRWYQYAPVPAVAGVGLIVSVALLIKPHTMAVVVALLAVFPLFNFLYFRKVWVRVSAQTLACFLLALYIGVIGLWALMDGAFTFNPSGALGLTFYGKYIDGPAVSVSLLTKLYQVGVYFFANLTVVLLFFLPVFVWAASLCVEAARGGLSVGEGDARISPKMVMLMLIAMLSIAAHLLMTAWFTAGAAILSPGEAQRLHGRYLGPALAVFPFLFFYSISRLSSLGKGILAGMTLVTLMLSCWFVSQYFKIYPWDNPLLFSFFNEANWYGWNYFNLGFGVGNVLYLIIFLSFIMSLLFRHLQGAISSAVLCLIVLAGCFQGYLWMYVHLHGNSEISRASRHLSGLIGSARPGEGIVIGHERYGRESYLLFNLASAPKVIDRSEGADITPQDISGHSWLITDGTYNANALGRPNLQVGSLRYYALGLSAPMKLDVPQPVLDSASKRVLRQATSLLIPLADLPVGTNLVGFNGAEAWGAWTSQSTAEIALPVQLKGKVRIRLFAWTLEQNLVQTVSLQVGDVVKRLPIGSSGSEITVDLEVGAETDRIFIRSAVDKPSDSARTLGVAIARLSVEIL